jgi:O-antigen ligase
VAGSTADVFFYTDFSSFRHPGYFAVYVTVSLVLIYYLYRYDRHSYPKAISYMLLGSVVLFTLTIYLLSSRMGFLLYGILFLFISLHILLTSSNIKIKAAMVVIGIIVVSLLSASPRFERLTDAVDDVMQIDEYSLNSSKDIRMVLWGSAIQVIQDNFFLGVGTDNLEEEMYARHQIKWHSNKRAHNQFLSIFAAVGFFGFLCLLCFFIYLFWLAFRRKNFLLFLFVTAFFISFQFESFMEQTAGSFFIPFILGLIVFSEKKEQTAT